METESTDVSCLCCDPKQAPKMQVSHAFHLDLRGNPIHPRSYPRHATTPGFLFVPHHRASSCMQARLPLCVHFLDFVQRTGCFTARSRANVAKLGFAKVLGCSEHEVAWWKTDVIRAFHARRAWLIRSSFPSQRLRRHVHRVFSPPPINHPPSEKKLHRIDPALPFLHFSPFGRWLWDGGGTKDPLSN